MNSRRVVSFNFLLVLILAAPSAADKPFPVPPGKHGQGELKLVKGVPVLFLEGTAKEIGTQHGKLVGPHIKELLRFPKTFLKAVGRERQWPIVAAAGSAMMTRVKKEHREEMQAAIAAADVDAGSIVVANTMLELRRLGGCSTLIVGKRRSKTGEVIFGRNFDFPPMKVLDRYGLVLVYRPKGKRSFVAVGYPGLLGVISGINDAGLCVATLDVYGSKDGSPKFDATGQPMMFTFRRILEECKSVKEAEALLRSAKATTWMNLAVCDRNGGVVFELTPKSVVVRKPEGHICACTNHFRTPKLATRISIGADRYATLIGSRKMKMIGLKDVAKLLHAVNQRSWTIQTMIFEPAAMKLHVSLRNPPTSDKPLTTLDVKALLKGPDGK
ncbi:MAG: C45 family autoproteolytic acyltransferase/hydrolase [Planctomycetaceae bacterium]